MFYTSTCDLSHETQHADRSRLVVEGRRHRGRVGAGVRRRHTVCARDYFNRANGGGIVSRALEKTVLRVLRWLGGQDFKLSQLWPGFSL